jgi:hypothetical protein
MPTYLDDEDTDNQAFTGPTMGDSIFFNDYPGEGSDQVISINIQGFTEVNPHSFYGWSTYFNEDPVDTTLSAGTFAIDYKLTWTEADTNPVTGLNSFTYMDPTVEDDVGHTTRYMIDEGAIAGFQAIQDDDPPQSIVDFDFIGTGLWYYDESLMANYLPYVDENNQIWVSTTDDIWPGMPGSGFDKGSSYAQFRVGVERNSATSWWTPGWRDCDDVNFPGGVWFDVQNDIVADGNIGGAPRGYYIIQFRVQDDVGNNIRLGDGTNEIVDVVSGQMFDSSRIYFKIARDFSWYHGTGDTTNGYTVSGSETFNQAAISVSDLDIPAGATLTLRDTEVFLDSTFNGERHVDVQGTLRTDSMSNTAGYDQRSAFTRRGLISHSGGPTDSQYTFWVRDAAILDMASTVVEGCGFSAVDPTRDDNGLYIRTDIVNADIVNSEIRFGYDGVVVQDGGGVTIDFSDIHDNSNNGISAIYMTMARRVFISTEAMQISTTTISTITGRMASG